MASIRRAARAPLRRNPRRSAVAFQNLQRERPQSMSGLEEVQGFSLSSLRYDVTDRHQELANIRTVCERLRLIPVGLLGHPTKHSPSHRVLGFRIQDRSFYVVEVWPDGAWVLDTARYRILLARDEGEAEEAVQGRPAGPDCTQARAQPET